MKKFFDNGWAFVVVAVLCFLAAIVSEQGSVFVAIGGFWVIMAIIVRSKNKKTDKAN